MVINNQDKIIITMTHAYVKKAGLFLSFIESRNINDSERFADVLEEYKVDLWLCAHTHLPHYLKGSMKIADNLNNTLFINISAIRGADIFKDSESFLLFFKKDSDKAIIKARNHTKRKYNHYYDMSFRLSHKFIWNGDEPVMTPMPDTDTPSSFQD
jgi:hypothetical protein